MEEKELQVKAEQAAGVVGATAASLLAQVEKLEVVDAKSNEEMTVLVGEISTWEKKGKEEELSFTRPLNAVIASIRDRYKPQLTLLNKAKLAGKEKQKKYFLAEQEKARQAELKRQEEERKAREEEERRLKEAQDLLDKGKDEEAEKIIEEYKEPEIQAPTPEPERTTRTTEGHTSTFRRRKTFRITDEKKIPRGYLKIDMEAIRRDVTAGFEFFPEKDGIEVYEEIDVATRTRR
jgi:hypothetical protein